MQVLADPFLGVERKPLGIADALEEHVQRDLVGAHPADVLVVNQPPVHRSELRGHSPYPLAVHRFLGDPPACRWRCHRRAPKARSTACIDPVFMPHTLPEAPEGRTKTRCVESGPIRRPLSPGSPTARRVFDGSGRSRSRWCYTLQQGAPSAGWLTRTLPPLFARRRWLLRSARHGRNGAR